MALIDIDLPPFVAKRGETWVLPSLLPLATRGGIENPGLIAIPPPPDKFGSTAIDTAYSNTNMMFLLSGGYSGLYNIALSVDAQIVCGLWNLMIYEKIANPIPGSFIKEIYWGVGARIGVIAWALNSEVTLNSNAAIAAATTLNLARSSYNVQVFGVSPSVVTALKPLVQASTGEFTMDTMAVVGQAKADLARVLMDTVDQPVPLKATVDTALLGSVFGHDQRKTIGSSVFAAERLMRGLSYDQALADPGRYSGQIDRDLVWANYQDVYGMGAGDKTKAPSESQIAKARLILLSARF